MTKEDKIPQLEKILKKVQGYSGLNLNPDFIKWKKEVVKVRLDGFNKIILESDPDTEDHKKAVIRYQELKFITDDIFKVFENTEKQARKHLKELEDKEKSS